MIPNTPPLPFNLLVVINNWFMAFILVILTSKKILTVLLITVLGLLLSSISMAETTVSPLKCKTPISQQPIAFVPFSNDLVLSPIILSDLNRTNLNIISENLPELPSNRLQVIKQKLIWQTFSVCYLIVGNTHINNDKVVVDYEFIEIESGNFMGSRKFLRVDNDPKSLRYGAHVIADEIYEAITYNE